MNFNDKPKDPRGTAAVTNHFFASNNVNSVGEASGKGMPSGGTTAWDTSPVGGESGQYNNAPSGAPSGPSMFNDNISTHKLPRETGVGYTPRASAGNRLTEKPFQGAADGMPGNKKMLWD